MMKINDENIGKFFQDQLKDVEVQPDAAVWSNIKQQSGISSGLSSLAKAALFVLGTAIVVSSYFLWQQSTDQQNVESKPLAIEQSEVQPNKTEKSTQIVSQPQSENKQQSHDTKTQIADNSENETLKAGSNKEAVSPNNNKRSAESTTQSITKIEPKSATPIIKAKPKVLTPEEEIYQPHYIAFGTDNQEAEMQEDDPQIGEVAISSNDSAEIRFSKNPTICFGEDAKLIVDGGVSYDWNTGANTSYIKVSPVEQSDYWVIVTDQYGNEIKHIFTVYIDKECTAIFVPSAFTPNGDGINDLFKAEGLGIQSFEMIVFNREGQIVFESHSIEDGWDGSYRNENVKPRAYFYQISYIDAKGNKHNKRGQVTLIK
jgi:gliding motility-associated-like protein